MSRWRHSLTIASLAASVATSLVVTACEAQTQHDDRPPAAQVVNAFVSSAPDTAIAAAYLAMMYIEREGVPEASRDSVLDGLERLAGSVVSYKGADVVTALVLAGTTWADVQLVQRLQRVYEASTDVGIKHMALRVALETGDTASAVSFLGVVAQRGYEGGAVLAAPLAVELLARHAGPDGKAVLADLVRRNRLINPDARSTAAGFVQSGVIK